jgi:hypothetical protein
MKFHLQIDSKVSKDTSSLNKLIDFKTAIYNLDVGERKASNIYLKIINGTLTAYSPNGTSDYLFKDLLFCKTSPTFANKEIRYQVPKLRIFDAHVLLYKKRRKWILRFGDHDWPFAA